MKYIKSNWHKAALLLIMALTGFLSFYAIGNEGYANQYYSAAVKSMLTSWHNFFFASLDPGGYVTVDKPALGLQLQAISAFIFGFHGWSLILPEALSAVISVALLYHIVSRFFGKVAGIASAFVLGLTPILIAVSRTNNLDASLVMVLLLAAWSLITAAERGSFKLLLLSMALVGLGFNIKMLQAFMIIPAFYLVYMFTSPLKIKNKILHLAGATAVLLVVSLTWAVIVDSIPADKRPYIGSSKTNSVLELALGYNGIQRITGNNMMGGSNKGAIPMDSRSSANTINNNSQNSNNQQDMQTPPDGQNQQDMQAPPDGQNQQDGNFQPGRNRNMTPPSGKMPGGFYGGPGGWDGQGGQGNMGGPGGIGENGQKGIFRLLNKQLSGQISWFLPMALFGMLILLLKVLKKDTHNRTAVIRYLIFWAAWVIPMVGFFSIAGFYHRYYLSMLAPGLAALSGIGIVELWKAYMESGWKWILLPVAIISDAALQGVMLWRYEEWRNALVPVVCGICLLSVATLIIIRLLKKDNMDKTIKTAITAGFAALLVAPAIWAYTPMMYGSQTTLPIAGPELKRGDGFSQGSHGNFTQSQSNKDTGSSQLIKFLLSKKQNEKYLVAVPDANTAASIIIETGEPVMAVGGFTGSDNILTVERLAKMVKNGEIRYFQIGGRGMGQQSEITNWVMEHGKAVTLDSGSPSSSTANDGSGQNSFGQFDGRMGNGMLYDLAPEKDAM